MNDGKKDFSFDYVFPFDAKQNDVYDITARQIISGFFFLF